jgi:hypothetical protein
MKKGKDKDMVKRDND